MDTVYHIGDLDTTRSKPIDSYEGDALSVTTEPFVEAWQHIAELTGKLYRLRKSQARWFYVHEGNNEDVASAWAVVEGYLTRTPLWRVFWLDEDDERFFEFTEEKRAQAEYDFLVDETNPRLERVLGYRLGPRGRFYVTYRLGSDPDGYAEAFPEHFAPLWYAEEHGYDGVWWDEEENLGALSAPRGAIFQSVLPTWSIEEV